eukprot:2341286-Prymnesium_polylepis.1
MERLLLWSAITGPGKLGGGDIFEPRDVRPNACFTVQERGRTVHGVLCEHRMLGLSVFSCGAQAERVNGSTEGTTPCSALNAVAAAAASSCCLKASASPAVAAAAVAPLACFLS